MDSRSPKLYFLPCLDSVEFNIDAIEQTRKLAEELKRSISGQDAINQFFDDPESIDNRLVASMPKTTIAAVPTADTVPHCPHCGASRLSLQRDKRYYCLDCKKKTVASKVVHKVR